MGTWGSGHFDSDFAADRVNALTRQLINEVQEAIGNPERIEPDEYWGAAVPCNIELLLMFAERKLSGCSVPSLATVANWRTVYLDTWDRYIDELEPAPSFKAARREALKQTFDKLHDLARQGQDSGYPDPMDP